MKTEKPNRDILVLYTGSYMGDVTLSGLTVTTQIDWDEHLAAVEKMFQDGGETAQFETFFTKLDSIAYDSFEQYKRHFKVITTPNKQVGEFLQKNFRKGFGQFLTLEEFDVKKDAETEKEIKDLVAKKTPIISANFFDSLRIDKRW